MGHLLVWSLGALGSSLLLPELQQLLLHPILCTRVPSLPREMTVFLPWLLCQFPILVTGVGSTWPRILSCSCQLPSPCLGHSSSQDPRPEPHDL